jgi:hypothetical protein
MGYHEQYRIDKLRFVFRIVYLLRVQYQIQELESCIACQALVTRDWFPIARVVVCFTDFGIGHHLIDRQVAKDINIEKHLCFEKSPVLGEVGRQTSKALAVAGFYSFECHIVESNWIVSNLSCLWASSLLESNERF